MKSVSSVRRAFILRAATIVLSAAAVITPGASAAQLSESVGGSKAWSVFKQGSGGSRLCWIVSQPEQSRALRGGKPVSANRGDIYLNVAIRPGAGIKNEVSMTAGYPLRESSSVRVKIGNDTFEMFTEGDTAWADSPESDEKIVAAMRRGVTAEVTGVSTRGTTTIDRYSLSGFTAALSEARSLCK